MNIKINYWPSARYSHNHKLLAIGSNAVGRRHPPTMCETLKISTKELLTFIVHILHKLVKNLVELRNIVI